ncbi:universal stress protein [Amycolatopsis sp. FDAARGOS 1241]|uniref:universal stress protein n=1 Tax=Amycolatopsis sp. FDAARGOS 1241 TaxID=2778070 RepID=UPI00194F79B1|nr:universal stress protein [Amycolatopsis sp. FDAARGOS 1241]QRP42920.1 universal stress protein [Amycolatopsis sp. FDAARGOS 1241]
MGSATSAAGRLIVVGFDGSRSSDAALRWVLGVAAQPGDAVHAVMVLPTETLLPGTSWALQPHGRRPAGSYSPHEHIANIRAEFAEASPVTISTPQGHPATELITASTDADLLVVGARGAGRTRELLLGSVSRECVRYSRCPVVVVTPEAARRLVPTPTG